MALEAVHVMFINKHLKKELLQVLEINANHQICLARMTNIIAWTAWLQAEELFSLQYNKITFIHPQDAQFHLLLHGTGAFILNLLLYTKTNQASLAQVVVAASMLSGLSLQYWRERLPVIHDKLKYIIAKPNGWLWASLYYQSNYLYPMLARQRMLGKPMLQQFKENNPETCLTANFFFNVDIQIRG